MAERDDADADGVLDRLLERLAGLEAAALIGVGALRVH
jgi:hypothetical protein